MAQTIIGRTAEKKALARLLESDQPELLAIYGRRRVGKTYLIKNYYAGNMSFVCSGEAGGSMHTQLANFQQQLNIWFPKHTQLQPPTTWQQAFATLRNCLENTTTKQKKVLFFDQLPWMDTHKSGFLSAFGYFWNMYLSERTDLLVVVCGSAASWMIKKIVQNKGGLHNRITRKMRLPPFTLEETKQYLQYRKIHFSDYQILQLYMVMGGIPHYLNAVQRGHSLHQTINHCCFDANGIWKDEFQNLYASLFKHHERHIAVITALAKKNQGLSRNEIIAKTDGISGGNLTLVLAELVESGMVAALQPYGKKKKQRLYRLMDAFSLFYFRFMTAGISKNDWLSISKSHKYLSWCGYAFETICMLHIAQIKAALGIAGIHTRYSSWQQPGDGERAGAQIDLLLDRDDDTVHLCEIKFSNALFTINKAYKTTLQNKIAAFQQVLPPRKALLLTFITTYGVADNAYRQQLVDAEITMKAMFHSGTR